VSPEGLDSIELFSQPVSQLSNKVRAFEYKELKRTLDLREGCIARTSAVILFT
jgi:hypothetical protein